MADKNENVTESDETQAEPEAVEATVEAEAEAAPEAEAEAAGEPLAEPAEEPEAEPMAAKAEDVVGSADEAPTEPAAGTESDGGGEAAEVGEPAAGAGRETPEEASRKKKKKRLPRSERPQRAKPKREKTTERKPLTRLPKPEHERGRRQERQGTVVSAAADKTIVVRVDVVKVHPRYKKVIRRSTKFHAHDEANDAHVGDTVRIMEIRPVSKQKRWRVVEIVERAR